MFSFHVVVRIAGAWPKSTHRHPNWTVIAEPADYIKGTENVKYLSHIAAFFDQLAPLTLFSQDDLMDVAPHHIVPQMHHKEHDIIAALQVVLGASEKPHFLWMSDFGKWMEHLQSGNPEEKWKFTDRCGYDPKLNPELSNDTTLAWLHHVLLSERLGSVPKEVSNSAGAIMLVSRSRLLEVMPSGQAYGRILENSQLTACHDPGSRFEEAWPFLLSMCDNGSFYTDACGVDRGSCNYLEEQTRDSFITCS